MIWDPVFGWDQDRIRMIGLWGLFLFLFSGFISTTEGNSFLYPSYILYSYVVAHDVAFLMGFVVFSMMMYFWWKREQGWL